MVDFNILLQNMTSLHILRSQINNRLAHYEPLTWHNAPYAHAWIMAFLFMGYLTRRPYTHTARLLFLPIVVSSTFWCTIQYRLENQRYGWYNWIRGLSALAATAHTITFAVFPDGLLKTREGSHVDRFNSVDHEPGRNDKALRVQQQRSFLPACISDAVEVALAVRGIGWKHGHGVHVPRPRRSSKRNSFLVSTVISVIRTYLFVDLIDSFLDTLPGMTLTSGSLYFPALPLGLRYLAATTLHVLAGLVIILGIEMWYDIASLIGVGIFNHSPTSWPPFHDEPWRLGSLHEFWSKRWHQALRHTFLVYGGYPGWWVAGDLGMLFGTFLASGLFHEIGFYLGGERIDPWVIVFFVAQPFGILAEKVYQKYTGKRVDGISGAFMITIFVVALGQICTNSWLGRGMGGRVITPPALSPARRVLLPYRRARGFTVGEWSDVSV
ncbi:hypothetical protein LXA43DRAFT_1027315 [Ganoderma leucocontextum]|nr:hypothetical protein LXA43DRAFT_1027315 [Ganoderma leucocontextum]